MLTSVQAPGVQAPPPSTASLVSLGASPEAQLLALMVKNQLTQGESAKTDVKLSQEQLKELRETIRAALEAAREAQEDSGFWSDIGDVLGGDIASIAEVVVVAAAAVATGGAAALVVGAIAIGCSLASKYADELGIPPNVAIGIGIAAALAMAASGNLAAGGSAVSFAGASNGAMAVGAEASQMSQLTLLAQEVKFYASLAAPAAKGAGAGADTVAGYYESEAVDHKADAKAMQARETLESMDLDAAIELLGRAIDRQLDAMSGAMQTMEANQKSKQLVVNNFQGIA